MLYVYFQLQCDRSVALDEFLKSVSVGSDKIALFGCGCSIATEAVAEISSFWNITHVSFIISVLAHEWL